MLFEAVAPSSAVSLEDGNLTINANNADLGQILRRVSAISSMNVEGLPRTDHIFGVYGPGNPRDVLSQLLAGSGYNFTMSGGTTDGVPRELVLTARTSNAEPPAPSGQNPSASGNGIQRTSPIPASDSSATSSSMNGSNQGAPGNSAAADPANSESLGPGAISHVPPSEAQDSANSGNTAARVQQNLQRLQQIQQQQIQQGNVTH